MGIGTNAPSDEILHKWFYDIIRFPEQVNNLNKEQLILLKRYLPMVNKKERIRFHDNMSDDFLIKLKKIKDEVFEVNISDYKGYIDGSKWEENDIDPNDVPEATIDEFKKDLKELEYCHKNGIIMWIMKYNGGMDAPLMDIIIFEGEFEEFIEVYGKDEDYRNVLRLVNEKIEEYNSVRGSNDCQEVFKSASLFCYIALRFFYIELGIEKYQTSKEAGKKIAQILRTRIKYSEKWSLKTLETHCSILYSNAILNRKVFIWEGFDENTDFYNKFKKVFQMETDRIQYAKDCFKTFIE